MVRVKNRYLLVNILYPDSRESRSSAKVPDLVEFHQPTTDDLTPQLLIKGIRSHVTELFGDYGSGAVNESMTVKYLSNATSTFILRVSRSHYKLAWAALSFMNAVPIKDGKRCVFRVVRVSGTIRKAEEEAVQRAREMILRARREIDDQGQDTLQKIFGQTQDFAPMNGDTDVDMDGSHSGEEEDVDVTDGDGDG